MRFFSRGSIIRDSLLVTFVLGTVSAFAYIAISGMIGSPGTIDDFGGIKGGTVFKLLSTNDPNSKTFVQDQYQFVTNQVQALKPNGSKGDTGDVLHFDHMEHSGVPLPPSNNGYLFIPQSQDTTWIASLNGNPQYAQSHELTYEFEDITPNSSDYKKTVTVVNFAELVTDSGATFTNSNY